MSHCFALLVGSLWDCQQPGLNQPAQGWQPWCACLPGEELLGCLKRNYLKIHPSGKSSKLPPCAGCLDRTGQGYGPSSSGSHIPVQDTDCSPILTVFSISKCLVLPMVWDWGLQLLLSLMDAESGPSGHLVFALVLWKRTLFWGFVHPDIVKVYMSLYEKYFMTKPVSISLPHAHGSLVSDTGSLQT